MSEYYGAPNDFRNYLEHKYDDRWVRYNKKDPIRIRKSRLRMNETKTSS